MEKQSKVVPLRPNTAPSSSAVKSSALNIFRGVRTLGRYALQVPAKLGRVAGDVVDAWHESARPNA